MTGVTRKPTRPRTVPNQSTFDPTLLQNDDYVIRVTAQDIDGHITYSPEVLVHVTGNAKLGNEHLDYTDLTIPLAGIPITAYASNSKAAGAYRSLADEVIAGV